MQARTAFPSSSLGYWRGSAGVSGPSAAGGGMAQGTSGLSIGTGSVSIGGTSWHPSVIYLLVLVVVEMVAFRWLGDLLS